MRPDQDSEITGIGGSWCVFECGNYQEISGWFESGPSVAPSETGPDQDSEITGIGGLACVCVKLPRKFRTV